ncbi:MAG TPA: protein kinase, partial [Thermoanaerobaculaceae bacterium]|nr:protein kinase [Thermoanaerobaculaceae bacterium]
GGEASTAARTLEETSPGLVVGTLAYMSPEQLQGRSVDQRSDVFSFGVMLYEMVAGERPFAGATGAQLAASVLRDDPKPLPADARVPPPLGATIARCLARPPADRFASAVELAAALAAIPHPRGTAAPTEVQPTPPPAGARRTLLILDFANVAGDPTAAWLSTAIAETVMVELKKLGAVGVAGQERLSPEAAARDLARVTEAELVRLAGTAGVDLLLAGSFQKVGEAIRLTASVLEVPAGATAATIKLDGSMDGLFALQDRLVAELVRALGLDVSDSSLQRVADVAAPKLEAYELYAKGRQLHNQLGRGGMDQARAHYEQAIAIDPGYALAYSGLGGLSMMRYIATTNRSDLDVGTVYLQRAAELDVRLADPHLWLTYGLARLGRFAEAHREGERAIALEPDNPMSHYFAGVAWWLEGMAEFAPGCWREASRHLRGSAEIAPRYQAAWQILGDVLLRAGDHAGARAALERACEIERSGRFTHARFVGAFSLLGRLLQRTEGSGSALAAYDTSLGVLRGVDHVYTAASVALARLGGGEAHIRAGRPDAAMASYRQAQDTCRQAERSLGIGWLAVRASLGIAAACRLLAMPREEDAAAAAAAKLLEERAGYDFSGVIDGGTAVVWHDWARYHALAGRKAQAVEALQRAVAAGWSDAAWLLADEHLEALRGDPGFDAATAAAREASGC